MYTFDFPSGLRFLHIQNNSPVAHFGMIVNTGTRDEQNDENGCAHLIEHSLFKGTENRSSKSISIGFDHVGADINAYTTKEDTCIHISFLSEYYSRIMSICADMLFNSSFPEKEIKKEINVIKEEIMACYDNPSELIFDDFEDNIYHGHSLGRNILGTPESLNYISEDLSVLRRFFSSNYLNNEIVIWSNGNISDKKFYNMCQKYFSDSPLKTATRVRTKVFDYHVFNNIVDKDIMQCNAIIGGRAYSYFDKGREAFTLLNFLMGNEGLSSRLNYQVREKRGLVYQIESGYTPYYDTGTFSIFYECDFDNNERVNNLIIKELKSAMKKKMSTSQLSIAKKQLKGSLAVASDSRLNDVISCAKAFLVFNKIDSMESVFEKIDKITAEDILTVANEVFNLDKISYLTYRPKDDE